MVPPLDRESGFYSRCFVVPKKDGGLHPILDLWLLNRSVSCLKFRMLTVKQVVSQIRVDSQHGQESQRRPVTHGQAVSDTAGSDGSSVQRDTFWPAVHKTPTVVAQVQGVLPEGKPVPHDQGHAAMPTCLGHVEETLVLVSGPGPGSSFPPRNASDGCIPDRLGGRS